VGACEVVLNILLVKYHFLLGLCHLRRVWTYSLRNQRIIRIHNFIFFMDFFMTIKTSSTRPSARLLMCVFMGFVVFYGLFYGRKNNYGGHLWKSFLGNPFME
jgi:hypothetical protein